MLQQYSHNQLQLTSERKIFNSYHDCLLKIPLHILSKLLIQSYKQQQPNTGRSTDKTNNNNKLDKTINYLLCKSIDINVIKIQQLQSLQELSQDSISNYIDSATKYLQIQLLDQSNYHSGLKLNEHITMLIIDKLYKQSHKDKNKNKCQLLITMLLNVLILKNDDTKNNIEVLRLIYKYQQLQIFNQSQQQWSVLSVIQKYDSILKVKDYCKYFTLFQIEELYQICMQEITKSSKIIIKHKALSQHIIDYELKQYILQPNQQTFMLIKLFLQIPTEDINICKRIRSQFINEVYGINSKKNIEISKPQHIFMILKLIQLFHVADLSWQLTQQFINVDVGLFRQHLYSCLCDLSTKGANSISVNLYATILNELSLFSQQIQYFIDLYLTLDSYGTHLIKDVWSNFYLLCNSLQTNIQNESKQSLFVFHKFQLVDCILKKVSQHTNNNIPKYCIQTLLTTRKQQTHNLFEYMPKTIYVSLPEILNTGTHYHDCALFHHDSKMYAYISEYYLDYYRILYKSGKIQQINKHKQMFITAFNSIITFDHAAIAYSYVLRDIEGCIVTLKQLSSLIQIINRFFNKLTVRKKYVLFNNIISYLRNSICADSTNKIKLIDLIAHFIIKLPNFSEGTLMSYAWVYKQLIIKSGYTQDEVIQAFKLSSHQYLQTKNQVLDKSDNQFSLKSLLQTIKINIVCQYIIHFQNNLKQASITTTIQSQTQNQYYNKYSLLQDIYTNIIPELIVSSYYNTKQYNRVITTLSIAYQYGEQMLNILYLTTTQNQKNNITQQQLILLTNYLESNSKSIHQQNQDNSDIYEKYVDINKIVQLMGKTIQNIKNSSQTDIRNKSVAKLVEYLIKNISAITQQINNANKEEAINMNQLNQRLAYYQQALITAIKSKVESISYYHAIEQCSYNLYSELIQKKTKLRLSIKGKLRLQCLLFCILINDSEFLANSVNLIQNYAGNLQEYCEIYDFQHYEELFMFFTSVLKVNYPDANQQSQVFDNAIVILRDVFQSMLINLDYGVNRKQVVSASECALTIAMLSKYSLKSVQLLEYLLRSVGDRYWGFQRNITFLIIQKYTQKQQIEDFVPSILSEGFQKVILMLIDLEQYRGEDSALLLPHYQNQCIYHPSNKLNIDSDYEGTTLRFATIQWISRIIAKLIKMNNISTTNNKQLNLSVDFWKNLIKKCMKICSQQVHREKMFLTGSHKTKIKIWQFLLIFIDFIITFNSPQEISGIIQNCLEIMAHNNLVEVRHYSELFMMKLIFSNQSILREHSEIIFTHFQRKILQIHGQTNLTKNITYIMISGLLLKIQFNYDLFTAIFTNVCSHIAYFRGLSQYICYTMIDRLLQKSQGQINKQNSVQIKAVKILYAEYLKDQDAMKLANTLAQIVNIYEETVMKWNVQEYLFNKKPMVNGQVVPDQQCYIDKFKRISQKLVKQDKNNDGFMPYKDIWVKKAKEQAKKTIQIKNQPKTETFQRKIDPSLDDLYDFQIQSAGKTKKMTHMKILVISSLNIAMYGHLARVGQILGLQQLFIPNMKITGVEEFKNVSCTAEKWLNISEHKFQCLKEQYEIKKKKQKTKNSKDNKKNEKYSTVSRLANILEWQVRNGYQPIILSKSLNAISINKSGNSLQFMKQKQKQLPQKLILILDQCQLIDKQVIEKMINEKIKIYHVPNYYSTHVSCTIVLWEYYKKYILKYGE